VQADAAVGTSVVIDLVEGGARLRTAQAERLLRGLADRVRVHLPRRGRIRDEDPDILLVDLPGRDRADSAGWMQPVLRDLAEAVSSAVALDPIGMGGLSGIALRGTVHDIHGGRGAQVLQEVPDVDATEETGAPAGRRHVRVEDLGVRPGARRRRRAADDPGGDPDESDPHRAPAGSPAHRTGSDAQRTGADPRRTDPAEAGSVSGGPGRTAPARAGAGGAEAEGHSAEAAGEGAGADDTGPAENGEALGLGDLLAGAMAAYRSL